MPKAAFKPLVLTGKALFSCAANSGIMDVSVSKDGKPAEKIALNGPYSTLAALVKTMGLNDQTFFSKVNGKLVHPATVLNDGDRVEFVGIIYGG